MATNISHSEFYNNIIEKRKNTAVFRKVVFHAHSPQSHDWVDSNNQFKDSTVEQKENHFIEEIKKCNMDLISITDHMKCDFACRLSGKIIKKPIILPGMEVNVTLPRPFHNQGKLHLIVIFDECYSHEQFTRIFPPLMPEEDKRTGHEIIEDLTKFVGIVHDAGGICIAAHVDSNSGTRTVMRRINNHKIEFFDEASQKAELDSIFSETLNQWIIECGIDAVEITDHKNKVHYQLTDEHGVAFNFVALKTNDGHTIDDIINLSNINHIKMTDIGLPDIRRAFKFSNTRLRFPDELPDSPSPKILGLRIIGSNNCFFENLEIAFSDNLTCIIGPRGAGKTTVIEAIRYLFGYNRTLDEIEDSKSSDLKRKVLDLQEATLNGGIIQLLYQINANDIHIFEATYDPEEEYITKVYDLHGSEMHINDIEKSGDYPLRLYGWSEIETIGREPARQIMLLDRYIDGLHDDKIRRNELRADLTEIRKTIAVHIEKLKGIENKDDTLLSKYHEIKTKYEKTNTKDIMDLFADYDSAKEKRTVLNEFYKCLEIDYHEINKLSDRISFDSYIHDISDNITSWWNDLIEGFNLSVINNEICGMLNNTSDKIDHLRDMVQSKIADINQDIELKDKEIQQNTNEDIQEKRAVDIRKNAKDRLDRVEKLRREHEAEMKEIMELLAVWSETCDKIHESQVAISEKRRMKKDEIERELNKFNSEQIRISIKYEEGMDRNEFKLHLEQSKVLTQDKHGKFRKKQWPDKIARSCTPVQFVQAIFYKNEDGGNEQLKNYLVNIGSIPVVDADEIAKSMIDTFDPFSDDDNELVKTIDKEKIENLLKISEISWDDIEGILLNDRPVECLSPGQRSSAMIPLVALAERSPLIIDQPEDNLDNKLVGGTLSEILSKLKEHRQIIVATHNPNIVVSGDAEQVIVLDADVEKDDKRFGGRCVEAGSIDRDEIVKNVIDIMEGGREAFETRKRRYEMQNRK